MKNFMLAIQALAVMTTAVLLLAPVYAQDSANPPGAGTVSKPRADAETRAAAKAERRAVRAAKRAALQDASLKTSRGGSR